MTPFFPEEMTITLGPRPGKKSLARLQELAPTHCATLLSAREDAPLIEKICTKIGTSARPCTWVWLPMEGGNIEVLRGTDVHALVETLSAAIKDTAAPHIYLHCSAGIHRTGFFAYILLRLMGLEAQAATQRLAALRAVTAEQVTPERIELAETVALQILDNKQI